MKSRHNNVVKKQETLYSFDDHNQIRIVKLDDQFDPEYKKTISEIKLELEEKTKELERMEAVVSEFLHRSGIVMPKLTLEEQLKLVHTIKPNEDYAVLRVDKNLVIREVVKLPHGAKIVSWKEVPQKASYGYYKLVRGSIVADENLAQRRYGVNN